MKLKSAKDIREQNAEAIYLRKAHDIAVFEAEISKHIEAAAKAGDDSVYFRFNDGWREEPGADKSVALDLLFSYGYSYETTDTPDVYRISW